MASSSDEAAALKRNVVHQTRLKLALRQLDRDRSLRIREINKDTQVFLHRLGESKKRVGLPDLKTASQARAASAPVRQKDRQKMIVNTKEPERRIVTPSQQDSNHPFVTKPSYQLANSDQRLGRFSSSRSLSTSALCPPIKRNETPSRDSETRTPRDSTISPRSSDKTRKEVRFSLPLQYTDDEDKLETPRTPSPIVTKGIGLLRIKNAVDRPSRRYSASHVRSKYL